MKALFTFGGIPLYLDRLLETLVEKGVELTVVIPDGESAVIGKNVEMSRKEKAYRVVSTPEKISLLGRKPHFPSLKKILTTEKPDIVVLGWPYFLDLYFDRSLLKTIRRLNVKLIIREIPFQVPPFRGSRDWLRKNPVYDEQMNRLDGGIGFRLRSLMLKKVRRFIYTHADAAVCYSSVGYDILPSYGILKEKIFVTYNSPDVEALWRWQEAIREAPPLLPPTPHRILHIGRLVKWKRVDLLISAIRRLSAPFPNVELVVVGNGPELENLKKQAFEERISDRVRFVGAVYDPFLLGQYMRESAVYVLAGMGGLSINEAMAFGLPVVCSVCDGTEKDLIEPGYNGLFFQEGEVGSLTDSLAVLLNDEERRHQMGMHALNVIRNKVNLDTVSDRFIEAFNTVFAKI